MTRTAAHRLIRVVAVAILAAILVLLCAVWTVGSLLIRPMPAVIGAAPAAFPAQSVQFPSSSGSMIHGWFAQGNSKGAVLLLHGARHVDLDRYAGIACRQRILRFFDTWLRRRS